MEQVRIAIVNRTTLLEDADVLPVVAAVQTQINEDFEPLWKVDAALGFVPKTEAPPPGMWWIVLADSTSAAGTLGYHQWTAEGLPLSLVGVGTCVEYNLPWSETVSHEALEMLVDPSASMMVMMPDGDHSTPREVCDACEGVASGYTVDGIAVSDFVTPAWFESWRPMGSAQFDYMQRINDPFLILPGGYMQLYSKESGWTMVTARREPTAPTRGELLDFYPGSRRQRRATPNDYRRKSTAR